MLPRKPHWFWPTVCLMLAAALTWKITASAEEERRPEPGRRPESRDRDDARRTPPHAGHHHGRPEAGGERGPARHGDYCEHCGRGGPEPRGPQHFGHHGPRPHFGPPKFGPPQHGSFGHRGPYGHGGSYGHGGPAHFGHHGGYHRGPMHHGGHHAWGGHGAHGGPHHSRSGYGGPAHHGGPQHHGHFGPKFGGPKFGGHGFGGPHQPGADSHRCPECEKHAQGHGRPHGPPPHHAAPHHGPRHFGPPSHGDKPHPGPAQKPGEKKEEEQQPDARRFSSVMPGGPRPSQPGAPHSGMFGGFGPGRGFAPGGFGGGRGFGPPQQAQGGPQGFRRDWDRPPGSDKPEAKKPDARPGSDKQPAPDKKPEPRKPATEKKPEREPPKREATRVDPSDDDAVPVAVRAEATWSNWLSGALGPGRLLPSGAALMLLAEGDDRPQGPREGGPRGPGGPPHDGGPSHGGPSRTFGHFGHFDPEKFKAIDPEMYEAWKQDHDLEKKTFELAEQFARAAKDEDKAKLKAELTELVTKHFEVRQQKRALELKRLEEHLGRLKKSIADREQAKESILKERIEELTSKKESKF